jgi:tetratricopeptide (TPR) repeat protein
MEKIVNIVDIIAGIEEFKSRYKDAASNIDNATSFWNIYNPQTRELLINEQYQLLRERMLLILRTCKQIDQKSFKKIHKGHPYFFIGIASYHLGDYQTAISFFDAALSEDLSIKDDKVRPTHLFFRLRGDDTQNAAQQDTQYVKTKVERAIDYYNDKTIKNDDIPKITVQDLRDYFIEYVLNNKDDPGLRTLLTTFITFVVEWDYRNEHFDLGVKKGTSEAVLMHLFRGCVMFESLLNRSPYPKQKHEDQKKDLYCLIEYYQNELKIKWPKNNPTIKTLGELLTELAQRKTEILDSFLVSYWLRNILGHNLAWEDRIDQDTYRNLYYLVIGACLHVINCLWRQSVAGETVESLTA